MRSEKQIAASRLNGAKSHGPTTPRQPSDAPHNAYNENSAYSALADVVVHPNESRRGFIGLCLFLRHHIQPAHALEHLIVGRIAATHWRQLRYWRREREALARAEAQVEAQAQIEAQAGAPTGTTALPSQPSPATLLDARTEHRLDVAFFRAVVTLYRIRIAEKRISGEKAVNLLKGLRRAQRLQPGRLPSPTQPDPSDTESDSPASTPAHIAELLTPELLQAFYNAPDIPSPHYLDATYGSSDPVEASSYNEETPDSNSLSNTLEHPEL